jgi:hypothetical protein
MSLVRGDQVSTAREPGSRGSVSTGCFPLLVNQPCSFPAPQERLDLFASKEKYSIYRLKKRDIPSSSNKQIEPTQPMLLYSHRKAVRNTQNIVLKTT